MRRSLALELEVGGKRLFLVNNHISSKYADDRPFGAIQPPRHPLRRRLRLAQARELRAFAERLLAADPKAALLILGDLNDLEWSEPVRHLARRRLKTSCSGCPPPAATLTTSKAPRS
ncbi:MAG: hypothetical protein HC897_17095 [Thermoanaerobaculia bacterium]|nr:hypothetical protein [Thermoanaerobaculia bacterium]